MPGLIVFELASVTNVSTIEIGGWVGDKSIWSPTNGVGATILTSTDSYNWTEVGKIPSHFGESVIQVVLKPTNAKYIKFQHSGFLGLGYLNILNY